MVAAMKIAIIVAKCSAFIERFVFLIFVFIVKNLCCERGANNRRHADRALGARPTRPRSLSDAAISGGAN